MLTTARLDVRGQATTQNLADGFSGQTQQASRIIEQLGEISASLRTSFELVNQLTEARETNGQLQEKLAGAERAQAEAEACNTDLKQQELQLSANCKRLQEEIDVLQTRLADASQFAVDSEKLSNTQDQLELASVELKNAKEALVTKEDLILKLEAEAEELRSALDNSKTQISVLANEKRKFEEERVAMENKVRAEFTKASLLSKEQNRACFEQKMHQLRRAKVIAEENIVTLQKDLGVMRSKLVSYLWKFTGTLLINPRLRRTLHAPNMKIS